MPGMPSTAAASARRSRCAWTRSRRSGCTTPALLLDDYDLYLRLALDCEIVFLEGPPMALYRHHEGQMTTYELTMGQIQTAKKHLALLDERRGRPRRRARAAQLPAHARAQLRGARGPAPRRAATCSSALRLDPGLLRQPWVARRLVASRRASDEVRARHGDPGAVPDPALQRARRAARPARALPRREDPRRAFYELHERGVALRPPRRCRAASCGRGGRWLVLSRGVAAASCGASRPTRSASAAGTSRRSGARSRTPQRAASRCSSWVESTARDARREARPLELARSACSCAA